MLKLKILPYPLDGYTITPPDDKSSLFPDHIPEGIPQPVSSIHGRIKTLLFVIPDAGAGPLRYNYINLLHEIVRKMDTVESFIVLYYENEFHLSSDSKADVVPYNFNRIHPIKIANNELSVWAQDLFYPIHYVNRETLKRQICLVTGNNGYSYKEAIKNILEKQLLTDRKYVSPFAHTILCKDSQLPFQGGNLLVGDQFILIGIDDQQTIPINNTYSSWFGVDKKIISITTSQNLLPQKNCFYTDDGFKNVLPANPRSKQPLVHIDLFITLAGYNKHKVYTLVIGEPVLSESLPSSINSQKIEFLNVWIKQMSIAINDCIKQLKQDFPIPLKVVRNPLVLTYTDYVITAKPLVRNWFWASYNNCLVEVYKNNETNKFSKRVWLPSFGGNKADYTNYVMPYDSRQNKAQQAKIPIQNIKYGNWKELSKFDKKNKKIWKKLGFKVSLLKNNYLHLNAHRGALNCITNCIERI